MTRTEFVRSYALKSKLSDKWAALGFIDIDGRVKIALPCGCDAEECEGWVMVSADNALDHLQFNAPPKLREAYIDEVNSRGTW